MSTQERYLVLARKYRPQNFNSLYYGQDPLAKTISYAILHQTLAQGYIFTGIRGVGKTSSARIIAKTANCTSPVTQEEKGIINACEKCPNCSSFNQGAHPDIVEIDAASHTGVDDVRELINSAEYKPMLAKYKFYIIDEVHMLSKSAFNALLKLLEEPPAHAIFILATTEINKIPLTIISRCQRFDLKRMSVEILMQLSQEICIKEKIIYDQDALELLCSKADGSARDALSLLDQANALAQTNNSNITLDIVQQLTNSTDVAIIIKYLESLKNNDAEQALSIITEINNTAPGLNYFFEDILSAIAYLAKSKALNNYQDPAWGKYNQQLQNLAQQFSLSRITIMWQILSKAIIEFKTTHNVLLCAEMLTIRILYSTLVPELAAHFQQAEQVTSMSTPSPTQPSAPKVTSEAPQPVTATPKIEPAEAKKTTNLSLSSFLEFLNENRHFDTIYSLMNETAISKFNDNHLILQHGSSNPKLQSEVTELLRDWSGVSWSVKIEVGEIAHTLKEQLIKKAKKSDEWQHILSCFDNAIITDIKPQ